MFEHTFPTEFPSLHHISEEIYKESDPLFLVIDLFCGAGGTSTGFTQAALNGRGLAKVIACVNHDPLVIKSHWLNHPGVQHFEEDIRTLELTKLIEIVNYWKAKYPAALVILWASLECTNFSIAKGGQPKDADSRTLANHLFRYVEAIHPDYIQIENVVEFMSWGPLDEKGKPVSKKNGTDWMRWREHIKTAYNYHDEWKELNSANFGAYTSRNRLFGCFAKNGLPICFPEATHSKKPTGFGLFGDGMHQWKAVREVLDLTDEGKSIFNRKTPLSDNSLERIYTGLERFVTTNRLQKKRSTQTKKGKGETTDTFITHYYGRGFNTLTTDPLPTITTKERAAIIKAEFFDGSIVANPKYHFLLNPGWGGNTGSVDQPCCVIVARQDKAPLSIVQVEGGSYGIPIYEDDTATMVKLKKFMVEHNLVDIKMRMLHVSELLKIQGFPTGYTLSGSQVHQKKFIGNSVVPLVVKAWAEALAAQYYGCESKAA